MYENDPFNTGSVKKECFYPRGPGPVFVNVYWNMGNNFHRLTISGSNAPKERAWLQSEVFSSTLYVRAPTLWNSLPEEIQLASFLSYFICAFTEFWV